MLMVGSVMRALCCGVDKSFVKIKQQERAVREASAGQGGVPLGLVHAATEAVMMSVVDDGGVLGRGRGAARSTLSLSENACRVGAWRRRWRWRLRSRRQRRRRTWLLRIVVVRSRWGGAGNGRSAQIRLGCCARRGFLVVVTAAAAACVLTGSDMLILIVRSSRGTWLGRWSGTARSAWRWRQLLLWAVAKSGIRCNNASSSTTTNLLLLIIRMLIVEVTWRVGRRCGVETSISGIATKSVVVVVVAWVVVDVCWIDIVVVWATRRRKNLSGCRHAVRTKKCGVVGHVVVCKNEWKIFFRLNSWEMILRKRVEKLISVLWFVLNKIKVEMCVWRSLCLVFRIQRVAVALSVICFVFSWREKH